MFATPASWLVAVLVACVATATLASDLNRGGIGAKHPTYSTERFGTRSLGAGRNDALGKSRKELSRGNAFNRRELGTPATPRAWDRDRDGRLSEEEYQDGFYGRYRGRKPTAVDRGEFSILEK